MRGPRAGEQAAHHQGMALHFRIAARDGGRPVIGMHADAIETELRPRSHISCARSELPGARAANSEWLMPSDVMAPCSLSITRSRWRGVS